MPAKFHQAARTVSVMLLLLLANDIAVAQPSQNRSELENAVRAAGKNYLITLATGDPKAIADFWTPDGTYTSENGETTNARSMIAKSFTGTSAVLAVAKPHDVTLRMITNEVALEEGECDCTPGENRPSMCGRFIALWVLRGGKWKLDNLVELRTEAPGASTEPSGYQADLEPFVGQWSGSSGKLALQVTAKWNPTKTFLIRDLSITTDGKPTLSGRQQIGPDADSLEIKSWTINSDGSHSEGLWELEGNTWMVRAAGVSADNRPTTSTQVYKFKDKDTMVFRQIAGDVGGQPMPKMEIVLKRTSATK